MEIDYTKQIEFTRDYVKSRNNITLVIKYLQKLNSQQPSIEVNNDSIRLLMESLKIISDMYLKIDELPIENAKLRHVNHLLEVENNKMKEQLNEFINSKTI